MVMRKKRQAVPMITVCEGGTDERKVRIDRVTIPDLWHVARRCGLDSPDAKMILDTWHLCHALKDYIEKESKES